MTSTGVRLGAVLRLTTFSFGLLGTLLVTVTATAQGPVGTVKAHQKIDESEGGFSGVLDDIGGFGSAIAALGDLDGNGAGDLAVGSFWADGGGPDRGGVWILFMEPNGTVASEQLIDDTTGGFTGTLVDSDFFGMSIARLGDLDGDGIVDIAVGDRDFPEGRGTVWILFLDTDGTVKSHQEISDTEGGFTGLLPLVNEFGDSIAGLGDFDDDGIEDIVVGAPGDKDGAPLAVNNGAVWLLFLNANGTVKGHQKISNVAGGFGGVLDDHDRFGDAVAGIGDLDSDGVQDLAVGASGDADGGSGRGAVWILFLNDDGTVKSESKISDTAGEFTGLLEDDDAFGYSVASAGDLDGDAVIDLVVGAPGTNDGGSTLNGAVWILFMRPDGTVKSHRKISATAGAFLGTLTNGYFGSSVTSLGDVDGDTVVDLAVGEQWATPIARGAVWILFLDGPIEQDPYAQGVAALDGRPGRSGLALQPPSGLGPGDAEDDDPVVVVPKLSEDVITSSLVEVTTEAEFAFPQSSLSPFETGQSPSQVTMEDFDGDLRADVVTSNKGGDSFSYLQGLPEGNFGTNNEFALPLDGSPVSVTAADFDGDTKLDVAVAGDQGISIFVGDGLGGFSFLGFETVGFLADIVAGDIDGDNDVDILATTGVQAPDPGSQAGSALALLNDGTGNLTAQTPFFTGLAVASVLLADFDGDTDPDALLAVHEYDGGPLGEPQGHLQLWLGDGAGGFTLSGVFAGHTVDGIDVGYPTYGAVADIGNNGWPDVIYTSSDNISHPPEDFADVQPPLVVTVLLNDQAGGFTVHEIGTAYAGKGIAPLVVDAFPEPQDGKLDCVLVWYQDTLAGLGGAGEENLETYLALLVGDGLGGFVDPAPNQYVSGEAPGDGDTGDLNGDAPADGGGGGPDIVVPNMIGDSLSVFLGDGAGAVGPALEILDVDDLIPGSLPPGVWVGGPREARIASMGGSPGLDVVVYNMWEDTSPITPDPTKYASLSFFLGDGLGGLVKQQYLELDHAGEFALADVTLDGNIDAVVTQRLGAGVGHELHVYPGTGTGSVQTTAQVYAAPAGQLLTGGVAIADVAGSPDPDVITTCEDDVTGDGSVLVWVNTAGVLSPQLHDVSAQWPSVRSLDVGDVTGDGIDDVVVGASDGSLVVGMGVGDGTFTGTVTSTAAASAGGGALRLGDINGDADLDVISSNATGSGVSEQAFVRKLTGLGGGSFEVQTLEGLSTAGVSGAVRPLLDDMNNDGATDLILVHAAAGTISILVNELAVWLEYGSGKSGKSGLTPHLSGKGYTTPGGQIVLTVADAVGAAPALLQAGLGQTDGSNFLAVQNVLLEIPITLGGTAGQAGDGGFTLIATLPEVPALVGIEITHQVLILDFDAADPPFKFSATNGLAYTILQ